MRRLPRRERGQWPGPSLQGIVGRKSGVFPGFRYSPALKNAGIAWDDKNLDAFLRIRKSWCPVTSCPFLAWPMPSNVPT